MHTNNAIPADAGGDSDTLVTATEVAEQVGREILESQLEPGAWATALAECRGRRQEALALYARLRVRALTQQRRIRLAKVRSFESRRLSNCMGDPETRASIATTIQAMLLNPRKGKSLNFMKPKLSLVWLMILFIGTSGTAASLGRLLMTEIPGSFAQPLTWVALIAGVVAVWSALALRYFLPKRWIMLGWNTGLVFACNVVCLSSLFLGTKVIKRSIATGSAAFPVAGISASPAKPKLETEPYLVSTTRKPGIQREN